MSKVVLKEVLTLSALEEAGIVVLEENIPNSNILTPSRDQQSGNAM